MKEQKRIRLLVVDDHPVVREGLAAVLEQTSDVDVVGQASNGREAVTAYLKLQPDVTLMDLQMPGVDGTEALIEIRKKDQLARVIVFTTFDTDENIYRSLQAGARGFLLKDAPRERLLEAIRCVAAGDTDIPPDIAAKLAVRMRTPELTRREMEVLHLLAAGNSNLEVGNTLFISEGTVKSHVNRILNKMGVTDRTQAVTLAIKRGLVVLK